MSEFNLNNLSSILDGKGKKQKEVKDIINYNDIFTKFKKQYNSVFFSTEKTLIKILKQLDIMDQFDEFIKNIPFWFLDELNYIENKKNSKIIMNIVNLHNTNYDEKGNFINFIEMEKNDIYEEDFDFSQSLTISKCISNEMYDIFIDYHIDEIYNNTNTNDFLYIINKLDKSTLENLYYDIENEDIKNIIGGIINEKE